MWGDGRVWFVEVLLLFFFDSGESGENNARSALRPDVLDGVAPGVLLDLRVLAVAGVCPGVG